MGARQRWRVVFALLSQRPSMVWHVKEIASSVAIAAAGFTALFGLYAAFGIGIIDGPSGGAESRRTDGPVPTASALFEY